MCRNDRVHPLITRIFSDEHFANGGGVKPIKTLESSLEQIQAATAGDYQCDVTFFGKQHLILDKVEVSAISMAEQFLSNTQFQAHFFQQA
jgi:hypothetical protein